MLEAEVSVRNSRLRVTHQKSSGGSGVLHPLPLVFLEVRVEGPN
jgi:hypothetical protein